MLVKVQFIHRKSVKFVSWFCNIEFVAFVVLYMDMHMRYTNATCLVIDHGSVRVPPRTEEL